MWHAFHESLGNWIYWMVALAIVFGIIAYATQRDPRNGRNGGK